MTYNVQRNWIAVASAEHVRIGRAGGFMQVGHGKGAPLKRMAAGDGIAYYSPTDVYGVQGKLQCFTALGLVKAGDVYQIDMGGGFQPFRRDVAWFTSRETPIAPLLETLSFTRGKTNWGYQMRFGLFTVEAEDMALIASAMTL